MAQDQITIDELVRRIDAAAAQMSRRGDGRRTLEQCRVAILHLAQFAPGADRTPGGIIIP